MYYKFMYIFHLSIFGLRWLNYFIAFPFLILEHPPIVFRALINSVIEMHQVFLILYFWCSICLLMLWILWRICSYLYCRKPFTLRNKVLLSRRYSFLLEFFNEMLSFRFFVSFIWLFRAFCKSDDLSIIFTWLSTRNKDW